MEIRCIWYRYLCNRIIWKQDACGKESNAKHKTFEGGFPNEEQIMVKRLSQNSR